MKRSLKLLCAGLFLCLWACSDEPGEGDVQNPPKKGFRILVSGEDMVAHGVAFPPSAARGYSIFFVDGWALSFESVILTLAHVQLSENPDMSPGDASITGPVVAELEGVFAIELKSEGGFGLDGHEHALGILAKQSRKKGAPAFDSKTRYAFGYSLVAARPEALQLGFTEASKAAYARMQEKGWTIFVRGKAEFKGGEGCRSSNAGYDFSRLPKAFEFELGFAMPVDYKNCLNPRLGEEVRGIQVKDNASVDAVVTLHLDHLFWEALKEDANLRLDAWAARKSTEVGPATGTPLLSNADLAEIDIFHVKDAQGQAVPYRDCKNQQGVWLGDEKRAGEVLRYERGVIPLTNLNAFIQHNLSTFGHLNEDGLCQPLRL
ncbi:MAG: hypothetical protein FWD46_09410 [Cystobacterineae bacterium]|nr:hypothetical protein [Cystobacterineae bacterium]